ncbi:MAG TPA: hypothetical protein VF905_01730, partial [Nitrospirota bacterium]
MATLGRMRPPKRRLGDLGRVKEQPPPVRVPERMVPVSSKTIREKRDSWATRAQKRFSDQAHEKLEPALIQWIHFPLSEGKGPLIEAYRALSIQEQEALDIEVVKAFDVHHGGASTVLAYQEGKTQSSGNMLLTTMEPRLPKEAHHFVDAYLVPVSSVMLHWGMSLLGERTIEHEKEIILKPGSKRMYVEKIDYIPNEGIELTDRIVRIVDRLQSKFPANRVPLPEVRKVMPDAKSQDVDRALQTLELKKRLTLAPLPAGELAPRMDAGLNVKGRGLLYYAVLTPLAALEEAAETPAPRRAPPAPRPAKPKPAPRLRREPEIIEAEPLAPPEPPPPPSPSTALVPAPEAPILLAPPEEQRMDQHPVAVYLARLS